MAKGTMDLILRDRLQFTLDGGGNQTTVYGRFDLSEYVSTLERKGLAIKEVQFMLRNPANAAFPNTGQFDLLGDKGPNASQETVATAAMKIYATTRAYEAAKDVGIASPDVLCVEQWQTYLGPGQGAVAPGSAGSTYMSIQHTKYGTPDLHPDGFPVVTDLLIGVATDGWASELSQTLELDVMLIASPITINQKQ
ncbi:unnamed protein product, partial [marine sediment metagenome]